MISSLLYVSQSTLKVPEDLHRVDDILAVSREHNPLIGVTGALIFTETDFAQLLEGPSNSIADLMAKILADDRHENVEVVQREDIADRRFAGWSMAWSGPSFFFTQLIQPLIGRAPGANLAYESGRLIRAMQQYARP